MTNEEKQQAIEWLKGRPITMPGAKKMFALAIEALEAYVPDKNVGKWISVSERLPEMTGDYIVTGKTFIGNDNFPKDFYRATQIRKFYVKTGKWDTYFSDEVVAWMPLPEPYKEGERNGQE